MVYISSDGSWPDVNADKQYVVSAVASSNASDNDIDSNALTPKARASSHGQKGSTDVLYTKQAVTVALGSSMPGKLFAQLVNTRV